MAQLKDKKQSANKAKNVKKTNLTSKASDKNKKAVTANKDSVPAVVNLGGKAKEVSKKGLSDLNYSDYYKDYLANKKDHKPDTKKIASLFKKATKPKNLGFSKIQQPKVFNATTPISYTKEVASDGYGKYFSKPGSQTVKAIPTVAVNLPAPINQTQQFVDPSFQQQQQYPNAYQNPNNFIQNAVLPVKNNQFNNPRNNFYPNPDSGFVNYNNQNFNQFHPGFSRNQNSRFNSNYQGFNNYPNNYFPKPINSFNQNPIDNVSTEQLLNFNLLDNGLPVANNANSNPNAIALANQRPDAVVLNQVTTLLDIMQRQMMTQQIILEKQQNQIERQQDVIERLQTKLIESQNQISTEQNFGYSDSAEIEPTDFLETQEHQFNDLNQNYYELDKTRKIAKNDRYDHFVDLSATKKIDDKKNKAQDTVHVTDTLEYETDDIGSGEIAESDLIEYTDFDDSEDLIDPNLSQDDFQAKNLNDQEEFVKTTADGQIDLDEKNSTEEQEEDDEYTDLVSEEIDSTLYKKTDDSDLDNEELIKTSELEEFDEDHDDDDYTDLVTEEHLSTSDLSESSKAKTKSDLIATSIIENLEEDHDNVAKSKKKDLNLSETKLSPTKRFWEPLVGNPQYGFYNKKSWNWIGYFDRLKKWIPYSDSNQAPQNPTFHNSLITKKVGKFNFWKKLIDNLDYGHRENGNWIWDGVFDQNFNWIPDPTILKGSAFVSSSLEKVDLSVDNDLYAKYIGNEYYGYYDDDHKWVWTGKFSTDGTFIPDKIDLVSSATTAELAEDQSDKTDVKKSSDQESKENQDSSDARKERKRLRQERRRLEKLQAKITSELIEKKNEFEDKDGFEKIPGETIEEIRGAPTSADENVDLPDEPAVINTKKSKKSEPHFWEAFLGNSAYGHYNSDRQWVWDGYFDDERNWVADSVTKKVRLDKEQVLPEIKKEQKEVVVATQETKNLQVDVKIQDQDVSKVLSKTYKEQLISLPEKTEGVVFDQKIEIVDSKQPVELKAIEQTEISDKQKETYLPTVVAQPNTEIAETIKRVSDGNQKVLKILDQTNDASITNAALQSESRLSPATPKVTIQDSQEIVLEHRDDADLVQDSVAVQDDKLPQVGFVETAEIPISAVLESNLAHDSINENQINKSVEYKVVSNLEPVIDEEQKTVTTSEFDQPVLLAKDAQSVLTPEIHDSSTVVETLVKAQADNEEVKIADKAEEQIVLQQIEQQSLTPKALAKDSQEPLLASETLSQADNVSSQLPQEETKVSEQVQEEASLAAQPVEENLAAAAIVDEKHDEVSYEQSTSEPEKAKESLFQQTAEPASEPQLQDQSIATEAVMPQPVVEQPEQASPQEELTSKPEEIQEESSLSQPAEEGLTAAPVDEKPAEVSAEPLVDTSSEPSISEPEKVEETPKGKEVQEESSAEAPAAEYWEQFVGNKDYGKYDKDGNWEWSGYFDDDNNWIPNDEEDENTEIVDAVEGTNFISADDEGKIDFDKYVGNENFGYYDENNDWEWYEGDFDEDGNWMVYEQGEPDKNYDITEDIPVFKNIDTDSVDADEWLSQFNEDDADTIFGGK